MSTPSGFPFGSPEDMLGDLSRMMSQPVDGPVAWELARETATAMCAAPAVHAEGSNGGAQFDVEATIRLADLWLDPVTTWPSGVTVTATWTPEDWVNATLPVWKRLCDPVAESVARTMKETMGDGLRQLGELPTDGEDLTAALQEALPEGMQLPPVSTFPS